MDVKTMSLEKEKKGNLFIYKLTPKWIIPSGIFGKWKSKSNIKSSKEDTNLPSTLYSVMEENKGRRSVSVIEEGMGTRMRARSLVEDDSGRKSVSHVENNMAYVGKFDVKKESFRVSKGNEITSFLQVKVLVSDMREFMQLHAFQCATKCYDTLEVFNDKHLAFILKKEFDNAYGPAWHCIVGSSFGSFVTHKTGCFLYFSMDTLHILLFRTKIQSFAKIATVVHDKTPTYNRQSSHH